MDKAEKPKESWQERRKKIMSLWRNRKIKPLIWINSVCAWVHEKLKAIHFFDIGERLGHLAIIVAVIFYVLEAGERQMQAENQRKAKHYQAWQVITLAQGQQSSGGRIDALQDLNKDEISLFAVDISGAFLPGIKLKDAFLADANLAEAELMFADLSEAYLGGANLSGADLFNANLAEATFINADLTGANIEGADLTQIQDWRAIASIEHANIYGIKNPPDGFIEWAIEHGAVNIGDEEKLRMMIHEKMKAIHENVKSRFEISGNRIDRQRGQ